MTVGKDTLETVLDAVMIRFAKRNPESKKIHDNATKLLPGGNTRTVLHTDPFPICIKSGKGYKVFTEDGHELVDFTGEFTAGLFGHSNPVICNAIRHVIEQVGLNVGGTTRQEQLHARAICSRFGVDQVRFTNSGTEANLHALAAARHFTKKRKVVVFAGGYHGSVLGFPGGKPAANNVDMDDWVIAQFNDLASATAAIQSDGVAAVLLEGMQGGAGCIVGTPEFLQGVQKAASEAGVLFILDEVMTSRLSATGFAGMNGINPDIKTFGKWLGGGAAFGAFGGRAEIMAAFDPRNPRFLPHSGTFNNNTFAMNLGYEGLTKVYKPEVADHFTKVGGRFIERLNQVTEGTKMSFTGCGSIMNVHFTTRGDRQIYNAADVVEIPGLRDLFWFEMLERGLWLPRRGLIALILETPEEELDRFVEGVSAFLDRHAHLVSLEDYYCAQS